jgi:hypothetical protein
MKCEKCGADLGGLEKKVASIHIRPMGDEEIRSYFLCRECDVYSVWVCIEDFFTDKDTMFARGPISREKGDKIIEKIRKCSDPDEVSCSCTIHKEMGPFTYD